MKSIHIMLLFSTVIVLVVYLIPSTTAQCMCSCSSIEPSGDSCAAKPPQQGTSNGSDTSTPTSCPDQSELKGLLRSLQSTVSSLKSELYHIKSSIYELQESIPEAVSTRLNITWTVAPGQDNPNTSFPGDIVWEGIHRTHPRDCREILDAGDSRGDGIYRIYNQANDKFTNVRCSMYCDGGGWMELMRRFDGSINFNRTWDDYVRGFGDYKGEFWMGLDFMNKVTSQYKSVTMRLDLVTYNNDHKYAQYTGFAIGDSSTNYKLILGTYTGSAGNGFSHGSNRAFSTYDKDNDQYSTNCASYHGGGWWFYPTNTCGNVWPTGVINGTLISQKRGGIAYGTSTSTSGYVQYKKVTLKVRPAFGLP